jgi:hypothetical protein
MRSGLGLLKVQQSRDLAVLDLQNGLDEAGSSGGNVQMADIGFGCAERAEVLCLWLAEGTGERRDFDGVADGVPVPWASR